MPFFASYHASIINSTVFTVLYSLMLLALAVLAVAGGNRSARYYLMAWLVLLIGMISYALAALGVLPGNPVSSYGFLWGSAMEAVLLSVALADRLRNLREENECARLKMLGQERMANLGLLSAGIAHEINNPNNFLSVSAVTSEYRVRELQRYLSELMEDGTESEIQDEFNRRFSAIFESLTLVRQGSERIKTIVKSMRAASRDDSKGDAQLFSPIEVLLNTLELVKSRWKDKVQFAEESLKGDALVLGYPSQLSQVYTNLLVNACHAIEEKQAMTAPSPMGMIQLESRCRQDVIDIIIQDNGCGMPEEVIVRLFEPFFTTKGSDRGTGLGMGICRRILEEHKGQLGIESAPGQGTTMTITLPLDKPAVTSASA